MRNLFVFFIITAFVIPIAAQQKEDPAKVLANALANLKQKDDVNLRTEAAMALADFGIKAEPALPDLLQALEEKNEDLRLNAAIALSKIGGPAIKPVAKLLDSNDDNTRFYAIWIIGWIGPDAKETIPTIIKLTKHKDEGIRRKAVFALGRLAGDPDKIINVLVDAFRDEKEDVRQAAGDALSKYGKAAVPALIALLKENNQGARIQAATSLGDIGSDAKDAVPALKELYLAKNSDNVHHYALMLGKIGKAAMPVLEIGFKDARPEVRQAASQAIQQAGAEGVSILVDAMGDKSVEVRRLAVQTLWPMRIGDKSVVIALAYGLTDADFQVKMGCVNGLAQLGPQAKLAAPKLKEALTDMDAQVRIQCFYILQNMGEDPRAGLKKGLESKDDHVRINTASLMVMVNIDANTALPILVAALEHKDLGLKMQAAHTVAQRQQHLDKVIPIFSAGLKHESAGVRVQALQGFSMVRNAKGSMAHTIAGMLNDSDANVRQHAINALHNDPGNADTVVPVLSAVYKAGDAGVKSSVLQVVWRYGGKTKDIVFDGLQDKNANVKQMAVNALQNWQGDLSEALPVLVKVLKDKEFGPHRHQFIWLMTRAGDKGVPYLGDMLKDSDENIRVQAMQVLRNLGDRAKLALPQIKEAMNDKNANVRLNAMIIIVGVGKEPELLLKSYQEEKDANVRASILQSFAYSGQQKLILPLLPTAMKDSSTVVRQTTVNLVGFLGNGSKEGFEIFTLGMKDTDNGVRIQTAHQANLFGPKSWPLLEESLKGTKDAGFRQACLQGMLNTNYRSKTAVEPLTECLKDGNPVVRMWSCIILGNIGPDAESALPALRGLAKDSNPNVQAHANNAINQINRKK